LTQEQLKEYSVLKSKNAQRETADSDKDEEEDDEGGNSSEVRKKISVLGQGFFFQNKI